MVPDEKNPDSAEADAVSTSLSEGLKSCRSVVDNYRSMIEAAAAKPDEPDAPVKPTEPDAEPTAG